MPEKTRPERPALLAAIWDDDAKDRQKLRAALERWAEEHGQVLSVQDFVQTADVEEELLDSPFCADVLFLDIMTAEASRTGLNLARRLRGAGFTGEIVFVSASAQYGLEGYEANALAYLLKPVSPRKLAECMERVIRRVQLGGETVVLGTARHAVRLRTREIVSIRSALNYILVRTVSGEYKVRGTLSAVLGQLPPNFVRCRRTDAVNMLFVRAVRGRDICLMDGQIIPMTSAYAENFQRQFISIFF